MKSRVIIFSFLIALVLVACPLHLGHDSGAAAKPGEESGPRVETDAARGLAEYVGEDGQRIDVVATDDDGADVACVEAVGLSVVEDEAESGLPEGATARTAGPVPGLKAIVAGRRADGSYALWAVLRDGSVALVMHEGGDRRAPTVPECEDRGGWLKGWMGWRYHVTGTATDGTTTIVVGYAESVRGFQDGRWAVAAGTTVAVYWKVLSSPRRPYCYVTPARVIGVRDLAWRPPWRRNRHEPRGWLRGLKLFLDGYFSTYLTMASGVSWDSSRARFVIPGTNEEGNPAEATIDQQGRIAISEALDELPDLTVEQLEVPETATMGQTCELSAVVRNIGTGPVASIDVWFTLSTDAVIDSNDTVYKFNIPNLAVEGEESKKKLVVSETSLFAAPGTKWIFVTADPEGRISEENEGNNGASDSVAVLYTHLVIDTYKYDASTGALGQPDTVATLYGPLWQGNPGDSITVNDTSFAPYPLAARIDYTDPAGIAPGTVFYVKVHGGNENTWTGPYAIRLVVDETARPNPYDAARWGFASPNGQPDNGSDDGVDDAGIPTNPTLIRVGEKLNLNIEPAGDVDWFKLVLP